eukprot:TRINITY_DN1077_c0_g1_i1.p1 TRINITY_DN1077_c0_g1~~TRINITY_DN1077_c0_g1_i1.p1  ORF type:complete len:265 (-),score=48.66 TRINITY_DN1077_c0_g1_i1:188-982(-)
MATQQAEVVYTLNIGNGEWVVEDGGDEGQTLPGERRPFEVTLHNARTSPTSFDKEGFFLLPHETQVTDFYDEQQVTNTYYKEVEQLLLNNIPSAKQIHIFDHTRRSSSKEIQKKYGIRPSAGNVHGDYTPQSGINRIRTLFPTEADELLKKKYYIVNVWRPSVGVAESFPLAFIDSQTTEVEDYLNLKRIEKNRVGEIQQIKPSPRHMWYFYPNMQRNEVAIFKTFDSTEGKKTVPHTAASLLPAVANPPPRESIEIRAVVFLE